MVQELFGAVKLFKLWELYRIVPKVEPTRQERINGAYGLRRAQLTNGLGQTFPGGSRQRVANAGARIGWILAAAGVAAVGWVVVQTLQSAIGPVNSN